MGIHHYGYSAAGLALTESTNYGLVQLHPSATRWIEIKGWGVSFNSTNAAHTPCQVRLTLSDDAGTAGTAVAASSVTIRRRFPGLPNPITALSFATGADQGTNLCHFPGMYSPVQGGAFDSDDPLGEEFVVDISKYLTLQVLVPAGVTGVSARGWISWME